MLQGFREGIGKHGKWLVVLFAIPFVFVGVESIFFSGASVEEVADVDGESISRLELEQAVQRQRSYLLQQLGEANADLIDDERLRGPALQSLVATQALANRAAGQGMGVAPQLIARVLRDAEIFWVDGKFSRDHYLVYLQQMGFTPQTHNRFLTREMMVSQLARGITQTGFVTAPEVASALTWLEETRDFHYLTLPFDDLNDEIDIGEDEVENYYRQQEDRFTVPEQVVLNYVELSRDAIAEQLQVDEAQLQERYQERLSAAEAASQRIIAQILVENSEDGTHRDKLAAIEQALAEGKSFAEVAGANSEDALTAGQGGELGPYVAEDYPLELREVIDALAVGEVSAPVETEQGWHIVTIAREDRPEVGSFAEEREALRQQIALELAQQRFTERVDRLSDLAYSSDSLATTAEQMDLELQVSEPLARGGISPGLGRFPKVVDAAFSSQVLDEGYASPVIEIEEGKVVVVELNELRPPALRPLDQVREEIVETLTTERVRALALERGEQIKARLDASQSMADIAAAERLEWLAHLDVGRFSDQMDRELIERVFSVSARQPRPVAGIFSNATGVVVYQVIDVHPGVPDAVPAARQRELAAALSDAVSRQDLDSYQESVLAAATVKLKPL